MSSKIDRFQWFPLWPTLAFAFCVWGLVETSDNPLTPIQLAISDGFSRKRELDDARFRDS